MSVRMCFSSGLKLFPIFSVTFFRSTLFLFIGFFNLFSTFTAHHAACPCYLHSKFHYGPLLPVCTHLSPFFLDLNAPICFEVGGSE